MLTKRVPARRVYDVKGFTGNDWFGGTQVTEKKRLGEYNAMDKCEYMTVMS